MANGVALARVPLIGGNKSAADVTRDVVGALDAQAVGAVVGRSGAVGRRRSLLGIGGDRLSDRDRHRHLGPEPDGRVGVRHHELRLLDRHRPRRHADLGDSVPAAAALAHVGQPGGGSDDAVRGDVRRPLSADPHGPAVDVLLDAALSERPRFALGELQVAARLGLLRDQHVFHDLRDLLVRRADSRSRDHSRPRAGHDALEDLRLPEPRLDRIVPHLAPLRGGLSAAGRARHAARALGPHHRQHRLRDRGGARLAHDDLPAVLRGRRHLLGHGDGADADAGGAEDDAARGLHHAAAHRRDVQPRHPHERAGRSRVRDRVLHRATIRAAPTSSSRSTTGRSDRWPGATGSWWRATS